MGTTSAISTFGSRDVVNFTIADYRTGTPVCYFDFANTTAVNLTGELVWAYGSRGHRQKVAWKSGDQGTLEVETQIMTMKLYELVTGGVLDSTAVDFMRREPFTATETSYTPTKTPVANSLHIYAATDDLGTEVTGDLVVGTKYIAYYLTKTGADGQVLHVKSTSIPKPYKLYGDTLQRDEDNIDHALKMVAYRATCNPNFTVNFANDGDPASITLTFDLSADDDDNVLDLIYLDGEDA